MLVFEAKLEGEKQQYERLDQAIRTARFIRNSCIRYWIDNLLTLRQAQGNAPLKVNKGIGRYELSAYCAVLAKQFLGRRSSTLWRVNTSTSRSLSLLKCGIDPALQQAQEQRSRRGGCHFISIFAHVISSMRNGLSKPHLP
jgi:hypothetical protein